MRDQQTGAHTLWAKPHMIIRGFKHLDEGMTCQGFEFKEGETARYEGELILCKSGFHFCRKLSEIPKYKSVFFGSTHFVECRDIIGDPDDKETCREVTIRRALTFQEWCHWANNGTGNLGYGNTGNGNTGNGNTGYGNTGNGNTGNGNTGNGNTGDWNTGNENTGNGNTGDWNKGNRNTGDRNKGNWNKGDRNTGDRNKGNWNKGDRNTGDRNTGDRNKGNG